MIRYALIPGVFVHELVHAAVARAMGAEARIDWEHPYCYIRRGDAPPAAVVWALVAPTLVGLPLLGITAIALAHVGVGALYGPQLPVALWALGNLFVFAIPLSLDDFREARRAATTPARS